MSVGGWGGGVRELSDRFSVGSHEAFSLVYNVIQAYNDDALLFMLILIIEAHFVY